MERCGRHDAPLLADFPTVGKLVGAEQRDEAVDQHLVLFMQTQFVLCGYFWSAARFVAALLHQRFCCRYRLETVSGGKIRGSRFWFGSGRVQPRPAHLLYCFLSSSAEFGSSVRKSL